MKHFLFIVCLALVAGIISTCTVFGEDPRPDDVWVEPLTGMAFVQIPSGCFMMGNTTGKSDEKPVHEACLFSFWFGQFEVTQGQWKSIMEKNPSRFTESDDLPVENISWNDAMEFISKLNEKTGEEFRLPTEAWMHSHGTIKTAKAKPMRWAPRLPTPLVFMIFWEMSGSGAGISTAGTDTSTMKKSILSLPARDFEILTGAEAGPILRAPWGPPYGTGIIPRIKAPILESASSGSKSNRDIFLPMSNKETP